MKVSHYIYKLNLSVELYIPHGSDESDVLHKISALLVQPLYPTWFRWKLSTANRLKKSSHFISHMVQMKGRMRIKNKEVH